VLLYTIAVIASAGFTMVPLELKYQPRSEKRTTAVVELVSKMKIDQPGRRPSELLSPAVKEAKFLPPVSKRVEFFASSG
jgi:hypothetical protein